nr:hypothetical protein [Methylomarinum sp. Ch1-1]MDP4522410.1 hypothetical protein [Methylomarinum sp. Ch1-1]
MIAFWPKKAASAGDRRSRERSVLMRFLSSAHPTRTGRADQAQRIRQRRAASRSKPPKTAAGGKIGQVSRRIAWRRITLRLHANVALPSDVSNSVKRIETRCACSAKVCP